MPPFLAVAVPGVPGPLYVAVDKRRVLGEVDKACLDGFQIASNGVVARLVALLWSGDLSIAESETCDATKDVGREGIYRQVAWSNDHPAML